MKLIDRVNFNVLTSSNQHLACPSAVWFYIDMSVCSTVKVKRDSRGIRVWRYLALVCVNLFLFHFCFSILVVYVMMVTAMVGTNEMSTRQKIEEKGFNIFGLMTCSLQYKFYHEIGGKSGVWLSYNLTIFIFLISLLFLDLNRALKPKTCFSYRTKNVQPFFKYSIHFILYAIVQKKLLSVRNFVHKNPTFKNAFYAHEGLRQEYLYEAKFTLV